MRDTKAVREEHRVCLGDIRGTQRLSEAHRSCQRGTEAVRGTQRLTERHRC